MSKKPKPSSVGVKKVKPGAKPVDKKVTNSGKQDNAKVTPKITVPNVVGYPELLHIHEPSTYNLLQNSMMFGTIKPGKMNLVKGLTVYKIIPDFGEYQNKLKDLGVTCNHTNGLRVACFLECFPAETFTNNYAESFLSQMAGAVSGVAGELTQMSGATDAVGGAKKLAEFAGLKKDSEMGKKFGEYTTNAEKAAKDAADSVGAGEAGKSMLSTMNKLLGGARVDFPMIWKNSSFNPSYSLNFKLYNSNPKSDEFHSKHIIGPLAALLCLGMPQTTDDGSTYNYPFVHQIEFKGWFRSNAAAIQSITVTKGAENLISMQQRPYLVEVRIEFINLFNTMVMGPTGDMARPTVKGYLDNLMSTTTPKTLYMKRSPAGKYPDSVVTNSDNSSPGKEDTTTEEESKKSAPAPIVAQPEPDVAPPKKVEPSKVEAEKAVKDKDSAKNIEKVTEKPNTPAEDAKDKGLAKPEEVKPLPPNLTDQERKDFTKQENEKYQQQQAALNRDDQGFVKGGGREESRKNRLARAESMPEKPVSEKTSPPTNSAPMAARADAIRKAAGK